MQCSAPRYVWQSRVINPSGKRGVAFSPRDGLPDSGYWMRCGKCVSCRMRLTGDWSVRMVHETMLSKRSCCATLTFDDQHVPDFIEEISPLAKAFKKRLARRDLDSRSHWLLEYGGKFGRPHAHVIFFNEDFRNGVYELRGGSTYGSQLLDELWGMGNVQVDIVSPQACRYTCGHNAGKLLVEPLRDDGRKSFYFIPAKRPAIGMRFARQFASDIKVLNASVVAGKLTAVPRAYLKNEPELFESVREFNTEFAKAKGTGDIPIREEDSERLESMARLLVLQAKEIQAWHSGCHR